MFKKTIIYVNIIFKCKINNDYPSHCLLLALNFTQPSPHHPLFFVDSPLWYDRVDLLKVATLPTNSITTPLI